MSGFCDSRRMLWISLISFGCTKVDFVVGGWISFFGQTGVYGTTL